MILIKLAKKVYNYQKIRQKRKSMINLKEEENKINYKKTADLRKKGFSPLESYCYDLKLNDYREYISTWEAYQPRIMYNPYFKISDDKYLFSLVFGKYIKVPKTLALIENGKIIDVNSEKMNIDSLYKILKTKEIIIKDRYGKNGENVYLIKNINNIIYCKNKILTKEGIYEIIRKFSHGIIQEKIEQGDFENEIFDKSINTIRIISIPKKDSNEHEIIGAVQRIAKNEITPVDNFHRGGISALIDINTGIIGKAASLYDVDNDGNHIFYEKHPDTGGKIEGKIIPNWEKLKKFVSEITIKLPFWKFIAWDFVVQNQGFALLEINMKSELNVFQVHGGIRNSLIGKKYRENGWLVEKWDKSKR